jgi:bacillithiol biosynthesis cysteine-adding enzyme BshC
MNISHLRRFSDLARDYITAFDSSPIQKFYPLSPTVRGAALVSLIEDRVKRSSTDPEKEHRKVLVETLRRQHSDAGTLTQKVEENLKSLASEKCCAIVTGQQVGIFGGPLYTIYKALHTIILANEFRTLFPEYHFVPVFWQETEDHDFEETSFINIITSNFELRRITYESSEDISRRQVGGISFEKEALERAYSEIESFIPKTDFTDEVLALYRSAYQEGFTFAEAQAAYLGELLSDEGLLILNPNSAELKKHAAGIFRKEIETAPYLSGRINAVGKELVASGYHAQLEQEGMNLFLADSGKRYKVSKTETGFSYNSVAISGEKLNEMLDEHPERFSMNVVMRPLVQDTILPTIAYSAGPGEIAYFAQLRAAYEWAGIAMPLIVPRIGMTILEDRFDKLFAKYTITAEDFLQRSDEILKTLLQTEQETVLSEAFTKVQTNIDALLESVRPVISETDTTLDPALTTLKGKLLTAVKDFESKSLAAERKKQSGTKQQFEKAMNVLLPYGKLQERELNLLYFLNKYGLQYWQQLKATMIANPPDFREHQIVTLADILKT